MKLKLEVHIPEKGGGLFTMHKEIDLSFIPSEGVRVDDPAWSDTRRVERVVIGTADGYVPIVDVGAVEDADDVAARMRDYEAVGWQRPQVMLD